MPLTLYIAALSKAIQTLQGGGGGGGGGGEVLTEAGSELVTTLCRLHVSFRGYLPSSNRLASAVLQLAILNAGRRVVGLNPM